MIFTPYAVVLHLSLSSGKHLLSPGIKIYIIYILLEVYYGRGPVEKYKSARLKMKGLLQPDQILKWPVSFIPVKEDDQMIHPSSGCVQLTVNIRKCPQRKNRNVWRRRGRAPVEDIVWVITLSVTFHHVEEHKMCVCVCVFGRPCLGGQETWVELILPLCGRPCVSVKYRYVE